MGTLDQKGADELVQGALDAGVTFFDTADIYSDGKSEKILGRSFKNLDVKKTRCCDRDQGLRQNGAGGTTWVPRVGILWMPSKPALKGFRLITPTSIKFTEMIQSHLSTKPFAR
jgi:hypothetical protein